MSFEQCINTAVKTGRLSEKKQAEALAAYRKAAAKATAEGLSEDASETLAAQAAVKETTTLVAAKRWARINDMRKQHALHTRVEAAPVPAKILDGTMQEVADIYKATLGQLGRIVDVMLLKYSPKLAGTVIPKGKMNDIVHGIYGRAVDPEVAKMAKATKDLIDFEQRLLNLEGASIPSNPNYRLWQPLDAGKAHAMGEDAFAAMYMQEDFLDWDLMQYGGKEIPVDERELRVREAYKGLVTSGKHREKAGLANTESLVTRLSRERFFYYKTPEAYLQAQKEVGTGNFFHGLVEQMDSTARNVSLMRVFGANPALGKAFLERAVDIKTAKMKLENPNKKKGEKLERQAQDRIRRFDEEYRIHSRDIDTGAGNAVAMTSAAVRTWSSTSLLGSAIVSNLSDPVFGMWMRGANRLPQLTTIPRYFSAIAHYKDFRQQVINNGIAFESLTNRAWEGNRHNLAMEGTHFVRIISDINYRLQGLAAWTQIGRGVQGLQLAQVFARVRDMPFDEIPFVQLMRDRGLTKEDWELFRATQMYEPTYYSFGKGSYLRPIDFYDSANTDAAREAANKFLMFQEAVIRDAIPTPTLPAKAVLGEHLPAGALSTQLWKSMTSLMLFPVGMHFQYWKKIVEAPRYRDKLWRAGTFIAYTTMAGAMITQVKDVLMGKEVHPMDTKEFWIRAMLNGGAGGILGDILYDGGLLLGTPYGANTPTGQQLENIKRLTYDNAVDYYNGEDLHLGADSARLAWGLFPFKAPGVKLVVERSIMDPILEQSDPAAYQRKLRAQREWEQDQGQGTWYGVGEEADFSKIFGE